MRIPLLLLSLFACGAAPSSEPGMQLAPVPKASDGQAVAVVAGGCFWCIEADFDKLQGVVSTTSGFAGGTVQNPTYSQVARHKTDHIEALHIVYDTHALTYEQVLDYFWHHVDPTDAGGQFCDRGEVYQTAIFPLTDEQKTKAEASKKALEKSGVLPGPVVTKVLPIDIFWPAEVYHQDFYEKSPTRYQSYRAGCGRDAKVDQVWSKKSAGG